VEEVYTSNAHRAAVAYRERHGWAPIPLKIRSKEPKLPKEHPFLRRKANDEEFAGFDFRHNVGIVVGTVSGIFVLDDDDAGETLKEHSWHVPATPTVKTRRGHQYYFRCPEAGFPTFDVAGKLEVRAEGAYVVAPPSVHPSGDRYEWVISPNEAELADPPEWLIEQATFRGRRTHAEDVGETISNGSRNKTLFRLACALRRPGLDEQSIYAALLGINATKCETPLDEAEVRKIAQSAARYDPAPPRATSEEPTTNGHRPQQEAPRRNLTDLGNAERFVDEHGDRVRWCEAWHKWLFFDGKRWILDNIGVVERWMKATVRGIYAEAAEAEDSQERKAIAEHAKRSESAKRITDALRLARSEPGIPIRPEEFDVDPWLFNVENGTLDLRAGELGGHRREDYITKLAPVEYDPDARAPTFEAFLARILPSEALRRFVQRVTGYAAVGTPMEEILVILHGIGANGKSTLVNVVMEAQGDYAMQAAPDLLLAKHGAHPTELADLFRARFVASVETDEGRRLAEGLVKQLTGRDPIKARKMREDFWQFDPTHTVFLATNHKPEVRGTDHAIWRRLKLVPFDVTIAEAEQDKQLPAKLRAELPGILAWIVRGCLDYQREGLGEPKEVQAATEGYRVDMDVLAAFIEDRCVVHERARVGATPLYEAYKAWCEESGESRLTQTKFGRQLKERGFRNEKVQRVTWYGIGLRDDRPDPQNPLDDRQSDRNPLGDESRVDKTNTEHHDGGLDSSRPESTINCNNPSRKVVNPKKGLQPSNGLRETVTPREKQLTEDQERRIRKLVREGMQPEWARKTVLARGHPFDCECEVCL